MDPLGGAVAGVLVCILVFFVERRPRLDDPVGTISVHGVSGPWGPAGPRPLCGRHVRGRLERRARERHRPLLRRPGPQLVAEEIGLDLPEIGALAYPDTTDLTSATVLTHTPGAKRAAA
jgi:ammonium transporter family